MPVAQPLPRPPAGRRSFGRASRVLGGVVTALLLCVVGCRTATVPPEALRDLSIAPRENRWVFESQSLSSWLRAGGESAERIGLADERSLAELGMLPGGDLRVKDAVYSLINSDPSAAVPVGFTPEERDALIESRATLP